MRAKSARAGLGPLTALAPLRDSSVVVAETPFRPNELDGWLDAAPDRHPFLCPYHAADGSRWWLTGGDPGAVVRATGNRLALSGPAVPAARWRRPPLDALDVLSGACVPRVRDLPYLGGAVGWLGYGLRTSIEDLPDHGRDDAGLPDLYLAFPQRFWLWQEGTDRVLGVARIPPGASRRRAARELKERRALPPVGPGPSVARTRPFHSPRSNLTRARYLRAVRRILAHIAAGDIYQANFSQRLRLPLREPPAEYFRRLRGISPAPYASFFALPEGAVAAVSPERFLTRTGDCVRTDPIKGTRPRHATPTADTRAATALQRSPKDRAELAMIVDLERNDLGRLCRAGSVRVTDAQRLESHPTVHHLVATVEGRLRADLGLSEIFAATFPGGSVTGVPKLRAMEILDELEPDRRSVYTGAIGAFAWGGDFDLSIAIRLMIAARGQVLIPVGGGIVIDSDPEREYRETLDKAAAQVRAWSGGVVGLPS